MPPAGLWQKKTEEVYQILRGIGEAHDGTSVEYFEELLARRRRHLGKHRRLFSEKAAIDAECDVLGDEDEVAVLDPELAESVKPTMSGI